MGCCCAKKTKKEDTEKEKPVENLLADEDLEKLRKLFNKACSSAGKCSIANLERLWSDSCDEELLNKLIMYFYGDEQKEYINFNEFSSLYQILMKGEWSELAQSILSIASGRQNAHSVSYDDINHLMRAVLSTCFMALKDTEAYKSWENMTSPLMGVPNAMLEGYENDQLASLMIQKIAKDSDHARFATEKELVPWLVSGSGKIITIVGNQLYQKEARKESIFPRCVASSKYGPPSILDHSAILMLNLALPTPYQYKWKAIYSSRLDGLNFEIMRKNIINQGPTLLIIADTDGYVFGGFAPVSWKVEAIFYGNEESFVFGIIPEMAIYKSTGKNQNYMYLNAHQQVLPNGLGMGGQMGCFGFFFDEHLKKGHCAKFCKTYDNKYLSSGPEFQVSHVEVWALGT